MFGIHHMGIAQLEKKRRFHRSFSTMNNTKACTSTGLNPSAHYQDQISHCDQHRLHLMQSMDAEKSCKSTEYFMSNNLPVHSMFKFIGI